MTAPRIRTTVVGSYPVPDWLVAAPSEQALVDATRVVIATQESAGIDVVCDGELYRFDVNHPETNGMIEYFVRPMHGIRREMTFDEVLAYRAQPGMRFRTRPPGVVEGPLGSGTLDLPLACRAPRHWRRTPSSSPSPARTCWPRPCSTATTATRLRSPTRSPTCSPRRCAISTPTSSSSTRRTCPAIPRNGSGRHRRSTASSMRCRRRPQCTCASATTADRAIQHGTWEQLLRYLNALHADHVVLECAHRPPEELQVFKGLKPEIGLGLGVVDIKATEVESADAVARAIERAEQILGVGRVRYIHPDCGFWMLKRPIVDAKIRALAQGRDLYEGRAH